MSFLNAFWHDAGSWIMSRFTGLILSIHQNSTYYMWEHVLVSIRFKWESLLYMQNFWTWKPCLDLWLFINEDASAVKYILFSSNNHSHFRNRTLKKQLNLYIKMIDKFKYLKWKYFLAYIRLHIERVAFLSKMVKTSLLHLQWMLAVSRPDPLSQTGAPSSRCCRC